MAARHGFALLFPEQQRSNNPNLCFNWFSPADSRRDEGEALSIRQMVDAVQQAHQIDPARIFVTGLSAGGAMTSVMLATYPELFAGGAIIAGLPYGVAASVPQAFEQMRGGAGISAALAQKVRQASTHTGQWPTISVWHGSADATVSAENARSIIEQWRPLHGADAAPREATVVDGVPRRSWSDGQGREVIEEYIVAGMGHGTPLHPAGEGGCGTSGAYMLDVGISSTHHICRFWGLLAASDATRPNVQAASAVSKVEGARPTVPALAQRLVAEPVAARPGQVDVAKVIEDALRSAGLMR
jgi:poly(hydroxyalkanoate) depolymerase family esterase